MTASCGTAKRIEACRASPGPSPGRPGMGRASLGCAKRTARLRRSAVAANERKHLRCAIYTRKSSEQGLEQDFNSLDAQREAAEVYIKSQAHEGWRLVKARYDDGGLSGGTLDRPALQSLLAEIRSPQGRRRGGLQGGPPDAVTGGFREAGGAIRGPWGVVRYRDPAVQYDDLDG